MLDLTNARFDLGLMLLGRIVWRIFPKVLVDACLVQVVGDFGPFRGRQEFEFLLQKLVPLVGNLNRLVFDLRRGAGTLAGDNARIPVTTSRFAQ